MQEQLERVISALECCLMSDTLDKACIDCPWGFQTTKEVMQAAYDMLLVNNLTSI